MYWPAGAPKIYTASSHKTSRCRNVAFDDEIKPHDSPGCLSNPQTNKEKGLFQPAQIDVNGQQHGTNSEPVTSPMPNFNVPLVRYVEQDPNPRLSSIWHNIEGMTYDYPDDLPLLSLKISRSGQIFAAITSISLTVWQSKVCQKLRQIK